MRHGFLLSAIALVLVIPATADAWNSIGHLAVSKLAYDQLDDGVKTKLFTILKSHPHFEKFFASGRPSDISEVEWVLLRSSIWPDWVRPRGKLETRGHDVTRFHRGEEHYINRPYVDPKDEKWAANKKLVDSDQTNVLSSLQQRANDLKTKTAADADKAVGICWLFHLIGDIHQPLHNATYFADNKWYYKGDQGGNLFGVRVNGQKIKLHMYWDNILGDDPDYLNDAPEHQAKVYREAIKVAEGLRGVKLSDADETKFARNRTFASWSREGYELAKSVAYQKADGSGVLVGVFVPFNGKVPESAVEAGADYHKRALATAEAQCVLAGRRLADRMKKLLTP